MKKITLLLLLLSIGLKTNAQTKIIKANPLGLAFGIVNVGIEFSGRKNQSTTLHALYYSKSKIKGFGLGLEQRFYFSDNQILKGFHAGPSIGYLKLSDGNNNDFEAFSIGAEIGHQWFLDKNFTLDFFSGIGFLIADTLNEQLSFSLGLSLGYAW